MKQTVTADRRLTSLDALRGFNMFWIIGADRIADALDSVQIPGASFVAAQLNHAIWIGFTFNDLIFPLFIFVVGISVYLSIESRRQRGYHSLKILRHVLLRTGLLFLLGVYMSNAGYIEHGWFHNFRWTGVLARIAFCYCSAAILVLFTTPRLRALIIAGVLIGYWLLLKFVPVPIYGPGVMTPDGNLANYIDSFFLPGRLYYGTWDPEGILSTFPAIATCLLGTFTGYWLKREWKIGHKTLSEVKKAVYLVVAGLIMAGLGLLWGIDFPIIKKIWTSSYVLLTGGLSAVLMGFFYWLIDVRGFRKWAFPFVVIGLNSIFIYLAADLIPFGAAAQWLLGGNATAGWGNWFNPVQALVIFLLEWLLLYVMYKRKWFIRL